APSMGAAIAFYTVFSLAPLVMIVIGVAGFFWGEDAVRGELLRQAPWSWCSSGFTTPHKFSCWEPNSLGSMPMSTVRERKKIRCPRDAVCGNQVRFQTAFKNNQNWHISGHMCRQQA